MEYNSKIEAFDWRYSAAIVGLVKYLDFYGIKYEKDEDVLKYNKEDITKEKYLNFVESYFKDKLFHVEIENVIKFKSDFSEDEIKFVNEKLSANTVLKNLFKGIKFDGLNKEKILDVIEKNRNEIIEKTFVNRLILYRNFCNTSNFFSDGNKVCRVNGYYIDLNRKDRTYSYNFKNNGVVRKDDLIFDFIPFGFIIGDVSFFINNNSSIEALIRTEVAIKNAKEEFVGDESRISYIREFFKNLIESSKHIDYDVEVIIKDLNKDFFETLFLRKESIEILRKIKNVKHLDRFIKIGEEYVNILDEVIDSIINLKSLNWIIIKLILMDNREDLKNGKYFVKNRYIVDMLIKINNFINNGGEKMEKAIYFAKMAAKKVCESQLIEDNKIKAYRTKLTSALVFKDYSRFCDILMQMANYTGMELDFAYKLFVDFEANEGIAYAFVNGLGKSISDEKKNEESKEA